MHGGSGNPRSPCGRAELACTAATVPSVEEERESVGGVVTMSIVSFGREYLSTTPFDKTAWLNRVCRERADGLEFVCLSHRADSSATRAAFVAGTLGRSARRGLSKQRRGKLRLHLFSRAQGGLEIKSRCFRPESVVEAHVIYTLHQRTPEVLVLQP